MSASSYDDCRSSGVEWLGDVPRHWTVCALAYRYEVALGKMLDEKRITGRHLAPYLRNVDVQWDRIETANLPEMDFSGDDLSRFALRVGDLLVCEGGEVGRAAIWDGQLDECYYQKALHRLRPLDPQRDRPRYMLYLLRAAASVGALEGGSGKATIAHLPADVFRRHRFGFPAADEQDAIVRFLDRELAKLDTLIAEQRRLIDLLREKRHALIAHSVSEGLNSDTPMKDSGVPWIGSVPLHWKVAPIKRVARLESGHTPSRQRPEYWIEEECVIPWFTLADVGDLRDQVITHVSDTTHRISSLGMENSAARLLPAGTVFLSRTASVGFSGIMTHDMAVSQDFAAWVCGDDLIPEYLLLCLRAMTNEFRRLMMGSTHQTIYMPDIEKLKIPLPPKDEQKAIVQFSFDQKAKLERLMVEADSGIKLMEERREALIFATATGKIDVRGATAATAVGVRNVTCAEIVRLCGRKPNFGRVKMQKLVYLAEAHLGIDEIGGDYAREAAGPLDRSLVQAVERSLQDRGIVEVKQNGPGSQVTYTFTGRTKEIKERADNVLGTRCSALRDLVKRIGDLDTLSVEAIATLYAVWNDALIDGETPDEAEIIRRVLEEWHPEKAEKFNSETLSGWLTYMRRNSIIPQGRGPHTHTPRLFA